MIGIPSGWEEVAASAAWFCFDHDCWKSFATVASTNCFFGVTNADCYGDSPEHLIFHDWRVEE